MWELHPGSELAGYRIQAVEREGSGAAVLLAHDPHEDRIVALHVAEEPPGAMSTVRFLERVHRLGRVEHPNLLVVYEARTLDGHAVAVAQAPPGRRLDHVLADGPLGAVPAMRIARQVASAVDALEDAGAEPPPLNAQRIWLDETGDAHLDGLDGSGGLTSSHRTASSSAAVATLIGDMTVDVPPPLGTVVRRALDGAYFSAGQLADELRRIEARAARRRRRIALAVAAAATLAAATIVIDNLL